MAKKFELCISATSEDGIEVQQDLKIDINCSGQMALGVIVNMLKEDKQLRTLILAGVQFYIEQQTKEQEEKEIEL